MNQKSSYYFNHTELQDRLNSSLINQSIDFTAEICSTLSAICEQASKILFKKGFSKLDSNEAVVFSYIMSTGSKYRAPEDPTMIIRNHYQFRNICVCLDDILEKVSSFSHNQKHRDKLLGAMESALARASIKQLPLAKKLKAFYDDFILGNSIEEVEQIKRFIQMELFQIRVSYISLVHDFSTYQATTARRVKWKKTLTL
jgi:hypothetical protein